MHNMNDLVGTADVLFMTLDTLRFDVASQALAEGITPSLAEHIGHWEKRHAPGNFTYASHHAMFAGFLPTPDSPGPHPRLFALRFEGSTSTNNKTAVFDSPNIISGFAKAGYHTACIGGVGFFNKQNPLGCVLPSMFEESHWSPSLGVTCVDSPANQVDIAIRIAEECSQRLFLFINASALHQPNAIFGPDPDAPDSPATQALALAAIDRELPRLFDALGKRGPCFCIVTSDHGTAYGEDGHRGHRIAHDVVWTVPYADFLLARR